MDLELDQDDVRRALEARGHPQAEVLVASPVLWTGHAGDHHAVLFRLANGEPHLVVLGGVAQGASVADFLRDRLEKYREWARRTEQLLEAYETEMDRDRITEVLRRSKAGELTRDQACEILNVHYIDLLKLERDFGIEAEPRYITGAEDIMLDLDRMDEENRASRAAGVIPTRDYISIRTWREFGWVKDDDEIRGRLGLGPEVSIPTDEEIERHFDRSLYGIDPDAPPRQVRVTATLGTENVKIVVEATGKKPYRKIAFPRWAGRNIGEYVDKEMRRLVADEPGASSDG